MKGESQVQTVAEVGGGGVRNIPQGLVTSETKRENERYLGPEGQVELGKPTSTGSLNERMERPYINQEQFGAVWGEVDGKPVVHTDSVSFFIIIIIVQAQPSFTQCPSKGQINIK